MNRRFVKLGLGALFALALVVPAQAASPVGTWNWTAPGRNGGPDRKMSLQLKVDGEKVTGTLTSPGRDGTPIKTEIGDGKLKDGEVSFTVTREFNGNKMVSKYSGKITGDAIKGKTETDRGDGNAQPRDWEAKREAAKK